MALYMVVHNSKVINMHKIEINAIMGTYTGYMSFNEIFTLFIITKGIIVSSKIIFNSFYLHADVSIWGKAKQLIVLLELLKRKSHIFYLMLTTSILV